MTTSSGPSTRYRRDTVSYSQAEIADAGLIESFKMKARNWWNDVQKLRTMSIPPVLEDERQKLLKYADTVKAAIQKVTSFSDALAIPGLSGMGALPLIPIAVVAGATGAIALWAKDYAAFLKQVQYQRQLVEQGVDAERAAEIARQAHEQTASSSGPLGFVLKNWQFIALGVGALLVFRMLKK